MKWFAYSNARYYPDAVIVEADSAEKAVEAVKFEGYPHMGSGFALFPLDALALWIPSTEGQSIEDEIDRWDVA